MSQRLAMTTLLSEHADELRDAELLCMAVSLRSRDPQGLICATREHAPLAQTAPTQATREQSA